MPGSVVLRLFILTDLNGRCFGGCFPSPEFEGRALKGKRMQRMEQLWLLWSSPSLIGPEEDSCPWLSGTELSDLWLVLLVNLYL